jgi:hypothetical protein
MKTTTQDALQWAEAQNQEFMHVYTSQTHWQDVEGQPLVPEDCAEYRGNEEAAKAYGLEPEEVKTVFGWCARLSAPGYLDCTDWAGPFETEEEAIVALYEMYGE